MVFKGAVCIFLKGEDKHEIELDWLGKGSVIGQHSAFSDSNMLFGAKSTMLGGTACIVLDRDVIKTIRKRRQIIDKVCIKVEEGIQSKGTPQIDFDYYNDTFTSFYCLHPDTVQMKYRKFRRAIRRLLIL